MPSNIKNIHGVHLSSSPTLAELLREEIDSERPTKNMDSDIQIAASTIISEIKAKATEEAELKVGKTISNLEGKISVLHAEVDSLKVMKTSLESQVSDLKASNSKLEKDLESSNSGSTKTREDFTTLLGMEREKRIDSEKRLTEALAKLSVVPKPEPRNTKDFTEIKDLIKTLVKPEPEPLPIPTFHFKPVRNENGITVDVVATPTYGE